MANEFPKSTTTEFKKSLGLLDSTALVAGSMIGSGIFIVSAEMARTLGSPGWLLIAWAITGLLTIIAALSYGELASMMPKAGGQYVYIREAFNPLSGFLYGWTFFMVIQTGTIAAVAMAFSKFMGVLFPWFSEKNILLDLGFVHMNTVHLLAISMIWVLTFNNIGGIRNGKWVQNIFTVLKVALLIGFIIIGLFLAHSAPAIAANKAVFWKPVSPRWGLPHRLGAHRCPGSIPGGFTFFGRCLEQYHFCFCRSEEPQEEHTAQPGTRGYHRYRIVYPGKPGLPECLAFKGGQCWTGCVQPGYSVCC